MLPELTDSEREALEREHTHKWSQPFQLYFLASELRAIFCENIYNLRLSKRV
jgi:hypothetical protein